MAALPQCFSYHCCIESLGKLPPKGFGQHTVNVSAILRILLWIVCLAATAVGSTWATGAAASTQGGAATAATGLRRERGAAGEASAQRSQQRQTTDRPTSSPEQRTRESLAQRCLRNLWRPVEPAGAPASPPQSQRATASGAVRASSADAARLRRRGSGCSAARRSQGAPPAARAQGLAAGICRLLLGSI